MAFPQFFSISFFYFMLFLLLLVVICSRKANGSSRNARWTRLKLTEIDDRSFRYIFDSWNGSWEQNGEAERTKKIDSVNCGVCDERKACTKNRFVSILSRLCHDGAVRNETSNYVDLICGSYACHCQRHDVEKPQKELLHPFNGRVS